MKAGTKEGIEGRHDAKMPDVNDARTMESVAGTGTGMAETRRPNG